VRDKRIPGGRQLKRKPGHVRYHWKSFLINILSPVILAVILFNVLIFAIVIPEMKDNLIERKHELIRELTRAELSEIEALYQQQADGIIDRETAQKTALSRLRSVRYGDEGKDYFWVTDSHPRMILHPYRPDLEGQDLSDYSDPRGKRLFVEMARVVLDAGEGRVDYLWQWKDDSKKIVPKVSFVKRFEPWDWVIGTGIYIEDVRAEVDKVTRKVINISLGISLLVALLLLYMIRGSLAIERQRSLTQAALRDSEEKYRTLVESNTEGIMLAIDGKPVFCNRALLDMTGHSAAAFTSLTMDEIIGKDSKLIARDGKTIDVIISNTPVTMGGRAGSLISFKDIGRGRANQPAVTKLLSDLQTSLLLSNSSIGATGLNTLECTLDTSIQQAAAMMTARGVDAIMVRTNADEPVGIVTDTDLRQRVLVQHRSPADSVASVMTAPLAVINEGSLMFEAALLMKEKGIRHLAISGDRGRISGILSLGDVVLAQRHPAAIILKNIQNASSAGELTGVRGKVNALVSAMLENGTAPDAATRMMSGIADASIRRIIELALERLGPPPAPFAFIVLGSEARREQTFRTDQDNGIIYSPVHDREEEVSAYFLKLGAAVNEDLDQIGYLKCRGNVMAGNPKWCRPLHDWQRYFLECVSSQTPQALLDFNVFFDFRHVFGDEMLVFLLRDHIHRIVADRHAFFFNLAESTLQFKPPIGFFGNLQLESSPESPAAFNIKNALTPMVNFARIYALKNGIDECNTLARLTRLREAGILHKSSCEEYVQGYSFLMRLRLVHQARLLLGGKEPDNLIDLESLTQLELSTIKKIFADIVVMQARLRNDFARTA